MVTNASALKSREDAAEYLRERTIDQPSSLGSPCHVWQLSKTLGYGKGAVPGFGYVRVHRAAYELVNGPIPDGLHLDHRCRNRACCNPDHLEAVTQAENNRRTVGTRAKAAFCVRGHARTAENIRSHNRSCRLCHNADQRARKDREASA